MSSCHILTGYTVNAADTCSYARWPQNNKTLLPSKQHLCYQIPPTYSCWESCRSGTLYFPILAEQPGLWIAIPHASKYQPMLSVLLCSAAAEGEQCSRSPGGAPRTRAGHMVGMGEVLQDWDCLSTAAKQKKGDRERRRGKHRAELPGKCAVDSLLGLLRDSWQLLWSPHHETQGWFVVTCTEHPVFFLRNKLVYLGEVAFILELICKC